MIRNFVNRAVGVLVIGAMALLGTSRLVNAQPTRQDHQKPAQAQHDKKKQKKERKNKQTKKQQPRRGVVRHEQNVTPRHRARPQQRGIVRPQRRARRQPRTAATAQRVPRERQLQLIERQRERSVQYRRHLSDQQRLARQRAQSLRLERRPAQYRYQQQYYQGLRRQNARLSNERNYNYNNDPYYYTASNYRYSRGGTYYETNRYGADLLKQAVNYGYDQGYRAGQADRQDRWSNGSYQDSFAYQDANYGYNGRYVDQDSYNHYFRTGFQRGYGDGYDNHNEYGHRSSKGGYVVLASVLAGIIAFEVLK